MCKLTRQQVLTALRAGHSTRYPHLKWSQESAEIIVEVLIDNGLVEKPREPGWYWVMRGDFWEVERLASSRKWINNRGLSTWDEPKTVGIAIPSPSIL